MEHNQEQHRYRRESSLAPSCDGKTDLFFSERTSDMRAAQMICSTCPLREPCVDMARERPPFAGVWGGIIFVNGEEQLTKRGRGRPSKTEHSDNQKVLAALGRSYDDHDMVKQIA